MTRAPLTVAVNGKPAAMNFKSGSNRFDLYFGGGTVCNTADEDPVPAFVRTKDNKACMIGYTCEQSSDE